MAGGEQALSSRIWREDVSCNSQEAAKMIINCTRVEGSVVCMYRGAKGSDVFNTKCVNPILQKLHLLGFTQVQRPVISPLVAGTVCHQLEGDNAGSVDPSYSLRFSHPFQGRTSPNAPSSTLSLLEGADDTVARGVGSLLGKGAVEAVDPTLSAGRFYSTLFLAPMMEGRMRPVINLKALNFWVQPQHFKMEDIHTLREIVVEGK